MKIYNKQLSWIKDKMQDWTCWTLLLQHDLHWLELFKLVEVSIIKCSPFYLEICMCFDLL